MLTWSGAHRPAAALALILSIATLGVPHAVAPGHDAEFASVVVAHDATAHHVQHADNRAGTHDVHCLACHWARAFRPTVEPRYGSAPSAPLTVAARAESTLVLRGASVSQPPLRSPPISPANA